MAAIRSTRHTPKALALLACALLLHIAILFRVILFREEFGERHSIDRAVGYGVAAHERALFGVANQILGTVTPYRW